MARIRTVKPEFWTSEQVMECSTTARLLFIGMWNFCDDAGRHPASAKTLKAEVFPADDIKSDAVEAMIDELVTNGLVERYEVAGRQYLQVTGWHHQKIEKPNIKHPAPEIQQPIDDQSTTNRRQVEEQSTPEGNGVESKGEIPPKSPKGDASRTLSQWLEEIKAQGEKPVSGYQTLWKYAEEVGLTSDHIELAWIAFCRYWREGEGKRKRKSDWRLTFLNAVKENRARLWWRDEANQCWSLTTVGKQLDIETREAA